MFAIVFRREGAWPPGAGRGREAQGSTNTVQGLLSPQQHRDSGVDNGKRGEHSGLREKDYRVANGSSSRSEHEEVARSSENL